MFLFHKGQTIDNRYTVDVTRDRSAVMGAPDFGGFNISKGVIHPEPR